MHRIHKKQIGIGLCLSFLLISLGLFIYKQLKPKNEEARTEASTSQSTTQEKVPLSDEAYIEQFLHTLKDEELLLNVNKAYQIDEASSILKPSYELAESIIEFEVQPETGTSSPDFAPNEWRTGKIIYFASAENRQKFLDARAEDNQFIDYSMINTNEINPLVIAHKDRQIVLELNQFIWAHLIEKYQRIFAEDLSI
ncbi:hypothetical protein IGI37_002600 [Enterococcus sp. AZ194]|uniref:hypothetical protein n=1 Tax=Enterococcus sp. AZ194 TaxID=2774629 RepID=UPI003F27321F